MPETHNRQLLRHQLFDSPHLTLPDHQNRILDFLIKNRLPAIFATKEIVEAVGLVSYGPNLAECTGKQIGLTIPQRTLMKADRVIR